MTDTFIRGGRAYNEHRSFLTSEDLLRDLLADENKKKGVSVAWPFAGRKPQLSTSSELGSSEKRHVHFIHGDLVPRNLLVRQRQQTATTGTQTSAWYDLAAVIDWEMAGFYPDGLDDMHQTTNFGTRALILALGTT